MLENPLYRRLVLATVLLAPLALALVPDTGEARKDLRGEVFVDRSLQLQRHDVRFVLERDGRVAGSFTEVSGLGSEHAVVEFREGGENGIVRKLPGRLKWQDIVLKRGITSDLSLWEWRKQVESDFPAARADLSIVMMRGRDRVLARWNFVDAWPSKISGPTASSDGNDIGVEELTIVHEGMERVL
jgi:phage tail-like protein